MNEINEMNEWMNEWLIEWMNECINEWMNACMNECTYVRTYVYIYICVCVCVFVCIYIYTYYIYTYIIIYIYIVICTSMYICIYIFFMSCKTQPSCTVCNVAIICWTLKNIKNQTNALWHFAFWDGVFQTFRFVELTMCLGWAHMVVLMFDDTCFHLFSQLEARHQRQVHVSSCWQVLKSLQTQEAKMEDRRTAVWAVWARECTSK